NGITSTVESGGLRIETGTSSGSGLVSQWLELRPGAYALVVKGAVLHGGLQAGVEENSGKTCLASSYFTRTSPGDFALVTRFRSSVPDRVRVVLWNWNGPGQGRSEWLVGGVSVLRGT